MVVFNYCFLWTSHILQHQVRPRLDSQFCCYTPRPPSSQLSLSADSLHNSFCRWLRLSSFSFPIHPWFVAWLSSPRRLHHGALNPGSLKLQHSYSAAHSDFGHLRLLCPKQLYQSFPYTDHLSQLPGTLQPNFLFLSLFSSSKSGL